MRCRGQIGQNTCRRPCLVEACWVETQVFDSMRQRVFETVVNVRGGLLSHRSTVLRRRTNVRTWLRDFSVRRMTTRFVLSDAATLAPPVREDVDRDRPKMAMVTVSCWCSTAGYELSKINKIRQIASCKKTSVDRQLHTTVTVSLYKPNPPSCL